MEQENTSAKTKAAVNGKNKKRKEKKEMKRIIVGS